MTDSSDDDLATAISNIVREDDTDDDNDNDDNDDNMETEDESVSVVRIVIDGKNYLLSDDDQVYDAESEDLVGHYNKKTKQILPHKIKSIDDVENNDDN